MSIGIVICVLAAILVAAALLAPSARTALSKLFGQSSFVAAAIVLMMGALALNTSTQWLKLHFKKQITPLRVRSLSDPTDGIPARLGNWVQVSVDQPIDPDLEYQLKTKEYINRLYVNTAVIGKSETDALLRETGTDREEHLSRLRGTYPPETFMTVMITFNTGLVDTVTHIPEMCYTASGYQPSTWEVEHATCGKFPNGKPRDVDYRFIQFEDQTGQGHLGVRVGYLFQADGVYESSPYAVRLQIQNLFERYGYYAKVEMMTSEPHHGSDSFAANTQGATVKAMNNLLTSLLPQLERCLPDWQALHRH